ncbi:MAG: MBL fold metallo-hydrolase RNA specificity domain-containing protein [Desulfococcaceae bacterium]
MSPSWSVFSAHADRDETLRYLRKSNPRIKRVALVHDEPGRIDPFAERLRGGKDARRRRPSGGI